MLLFPKPDGITPPPIQPPIKKNKKEVAAIVNKAVAGKYTIDWWIAYLNKNWV